MSDQFGDDIITITDEDGVEYVLEVLSVLEVDGSEYYALVPAEDDDSQEDLEVTILKVTEENGEEILCAIEDEQEPEHVYQAMMDELYRDDDTEEE